MLFMSDIVAWLRENVDIVLKSWLLNMLKLGKVFRLKTLAQ